MNTIHNVDESQDDDKLRIDYSVGETKDLIGSRNPPLEILNKEVITVLSKEI